MIPLIRGQRKSNYDYRDSLPVNMTAVVSQIEGDSGYLLAHDGLKEFSSTRGKARGGYYSERLNKHFRVSGIWLESINEDGTTEEIGIIEGDAPCEFAESFNTQAVLSDGKVWLYDGFTLEALDLDFSPIDIEWFRSIYVYTDGENLYHSQIVDETNVPILAYSSSEFSTDPIKGLLRTDSNEIVAFNRYSTEYFTFDANAPTGGSVLRVQQGKSGRIGIVGTQCKCFLDGSIFILGGRKDESPSVHITNGAQTSPIATREIDKIISKYTESELESVYMESRTVDRDQFVILHLPSETLLYNHTIAKQQGSTVAWTILKTGDNEPWRAKYGIFDPRISKWVYGDIKENKLGTLDSESFAQYDEAQELLFYTPIIPAQRISINQMEIDTISGFAPRTESCFMAMSHDAVGWGQEYPIQVTSPNDYGVRYLIRRLGYISASFSMRFRFISKDKMAFSGLKINAS